MWETGIEKGLNVKVFIEEIMKEKVQMKPGDVWRAMMYVCPLLREKGKEGGKFG